MRIDRFLFFVRLARTRGIAQDMVRAGGYRIDGRPVLSAHSELRPGQTLTFVENGTVRAIEILSLPRRRGPAAEARLHFRDRLGQQPIDAGAGDL